MALPQQSTVIDHPAERGAQARSRAPASGPCDHEGPAGLGYPFGAWLAGSSTTRYEVERRLFGGERTLGRYRVDTRIGQGAMGVVYAAHDPELDRPVAIKVVAPDRAESALYRDALLRDAQAAARVRHPAVVQVYDCGTSDGEAFVVMELVEGGRTLRDWLRQRRRGWKEIVRMFVRAGQGLQAVHDEGLIHRDFKPSNVLLDQDDRPRVTDFGLAQAYADPMQGTARDEGPGASCRASATIAGTPRYMAPEQYTPGAAGPHSDQYALCVCLYEALFGAHPLVDDDGGWVDHSMVASVHHRLRARGRRVPRQITRALLRGLSPDPARRHPSLRVLLEILGAATRPRPRSLGGYVLPSLLMLATALLGNRVLHGTMQTCVAAAEQVDQRWASERASVEARLRQLGGDDPMVDAILAQLDRNAAALVNESKAACVDASRPFARPDAPCLIGHRADFDRLVERLASWEHDLWTALELVQQADVTRRCDPTDIADASPLALHTSLELLQEAREARLLGDWDGARHHAQRAYAKAEAAGLAELAATARLQEASAHLDEGSVFEARALLDPLPAALPEPPPRLRAALALASLRADLLETDTGPAHLDRMAATLDEAESWVDRAGSPPEQLVALGLSRAHVQLRQGHPRDALATYRAITRQPSHAPISRRSATLAHNLAVALVGADAPDQAEAVVVDALHELAQALGPEHPELASLRHVYARLLAMRGEHAQAQEEFEAARALLQQREDAQSLRELLNVQHGLATLAYTRRDLPAAAAAYAEVLELQELSLGEDSEELSWTLDTLAEVELRRGDPEAALPHARRRLELSARTHGPGHVQHALSALLLGKVELARGHDLAARDHLLHAWATLHDHDQARLVWRAEGAFVLGRALHRTGETARARALVDQARRYARRAPEAAALLAEIERWSPAQEITP